MIRKSVLFSLFLLLSASALAAGGDRKSHPFGIYAGFGSHEVQSLNVGFALTDEWRLHGGDYVSLKNGFKSYNVYEAGLIYFTSHDGLSPFVGGELEGIGLSGSKDGKITGISSSLAAEAGLDWTAHSGFNLGMRATLPLSDLTNPWFNAYIGWYF